MNMGSSFETAGKKIQDLMSLYAQLDSLPNRAQWRFDSNYKNGTACAFVFNHNSTDVAQRYDSLNALSAILSRAGIKNSIIAKNGIISDIVIDPEQADWARKTFAKYQQNTQPLGHALELNQRTK